MESNDLLESEARSHLVGYAEYHNVCLGKLRAIWRQVGNSTEDVRAFYQTATQNAQNAWQDAVQRAEQARTALKLEIANINSEIASIRSELDDPEPAEAANAIEADATLLRTVEAISGTLQMWRSKRASRVQAYESLMAVHVALKQQLGIRHVPVDDIDVSTGNLNYLQMENNNLREEKARRLVRVEEQLGALREVCRELGEDAAVVAAEVHPTLQAISSEQESAEVLGSVYHTLASPALLPGAGMGAAAAASGGRTPGGAAAAAGGGAGSVSAVLGGAESELDLSDAMFGRLDAKLRQMRELKTEREASLRATHEVLCSLWGALGTPEDAPERAAVSRLLAGDRPNRLHRRTLDKCTAEVNRLEGCKAQALRDLALSKAHELEALCLSSRIPPPLLGPLLADLERPGAATGVLSRLVRLVAEVGGLAAKRQPILAQVAALQEAVSDSAWLRQYNADTGRYKGRDASRNMQRAIRAGKLRERLGAMLEGLVRDLEAWEVEEGGPFTYDDTTLQHSVLAAVQAEIDQVAQEKAPKPKASATTGPSTATRPPTGSRPGPGPSASVRASMAGAPSRPGTAATPAGERPMLTPRTLGGTTGRRQSFAGPLGPPPSASARDPGTFSAGKGLTTADFMRAALQPSASSASLSMSMSVSMQGAKDSHNVRASHAHVTPTRAAATAAAAPTPSPLPATSTLSTASVATAARSTATARNPAEDLFKRYLGDQPGPEQPHPHHQHQQQGGTPVSRAVYGTGTGGGGGGAKDGPRAKLSFSAVGVGGGGGGAGEEDDGADDVVRARCDTPKSTATSRTVQLGGGMGMGAAGGLKSPQVATPSNAGIAQSVVSPGAGAGGKVSRIPKLRL